MQLVIFLIAWFVFTFGPGIAITGRLTRELDPLRRVIVALGVGSAASPVLINLLGRLHLVEAFPVLAVVLGGVGLWSGGSIRLSASARAARHGETSPKPGEGGKPDPTATMDVRRDAVACALLVALAAGLGAIVFAHRMAATPDGIVLYGE